LTGHGQTALPTETQHPIVATDLKRPPAGAWLTLALPLAGLGALLLAVAAYWVWIVLELRFLSVAPMNVAALSFAKGLVLWSSISVVMLGAFVWTSVVGWRVWVETRDALPERWRHPIGTLLLGVYVAALAIGWYPNTIEGTGIDDFVHVSLRTLMGFAGLSSLLLQWDPRSLVWMQGGLEAAFAVNGAAAAGGIVALAFGAATLGLKSRTADAEELYLLFQRFQLMLWSAGVFLVLLVLQLHLLVSWPEQLARTTPAPPPELVPDWKGFVAGLGQVAHAAAFAAGTLFSGFAAVIFLPVGVLQPRRLQELILDEIRVDPKFDREGWLKRHGFADATPLAFFLKTAGVLAPLATGLLTQLLGSAPR